MSATAILPALIPLILMILAPNLRADTCSPIRLSEPGGAMEHIPVLDQGDSSFCFAYSAASLVDTWQGTHGLKSSEWHTSALASAVLGIGLDAHEEVSLEDLESGGRVCDVVEQYQILGSCISKQKDSGDFWIALEKLVRDYHQNGPTPERREKTAKLAHELFEKNHYARDRIPPISVLSSLLYRDQPGMFLRGAILYGCNDDWVRPLPIPDCQSESLSFSEVDRLLGGDDPQPVSISYCGRMLRHGHETLGLNPLRKCAMHASLIIGRRRNPKTSQCEYLIRNSWGDYQKYSSDWEHDVGYHREDIWVDADTLSSNVSRIHFLDDLL